MPGAKLNWNADKTLKWAADLTGQRMDILASLTVKEVKRLMAEPKSGRDWRKPVIEKTGDFSYKKTGGHVNRKMKRRSSAPGEAPAIQARELLKSYGWRRIGKVDRRVGSSDFKSRLLEEGTKSMKPRPVLRQALENMRPLAEGIMSREMTIKGEGGE